jgi:hypothetical protein
MRTFEKQGACHPAGKESDDRGRFARLVLDRGAREAVEMRADLEFFRPFGGGERGFEALKREFRFDLV